MEFLVIAIKTLFFYFFIVLAYRIMGKREVGQLGIIDLIVSILIAEMVAISIENFDKSILYAIVPVSVLIFLEIALAFLTLKSKKIRSFFNGRPSLIIKNGKINFSEMSKLRYSIDDLLLQLRQNSIKSIEEIEYAFLETNGKLSIFPYNFLKLKSDFPMPIIVNGFIQKDTLKNINKTKLWLLKKLFDKNIGLKDVFYAFYKGKTLYIISKN